MRRYVPLIIFSIGLGATVMALVVLRSNGEDAADESLLYRIALGILYVLVTVGPAAIAHYQLERIPGANQRKRELKRLKKEYEAVAKRKKKALAGIKAIVDNHEANRYWAERARGRYDRIWKNWAALNTTPTEPDDAA